MFCNLPRLHIDTTRDGVALFLLFRKHISISEHVIAVWDVTTSKSPRRVLQLAYDAAREALPAHRHKFSPKKFTQHQLLACLVFKEF
jgi:hypothetical protein